MLSSCFYLLYVGQLMPNLIQMVIVKLTLLLSFFHFIF